MRCYRTGIVDQYRYSTQFLIDGGEEAHDIGLVGHIRSNGKRLNTKRFYIVKYGLRGDFIDQEIDTDRIPLFSELPNGCCADSPATSGDERDG
jgi:hypothetical protein